VNETPFFFDGNGYRLFGVIHDPEIKPNGRGFVFCHPFAEEKLWAHRVFVNFARILSQEGYFVFRFDYMGNGDSEGDFSDSSVETQLSDIKAAVAWLQTNRPVEAGTGLLGLRFGASLASIAAEREKNLSIVVLWEPITNCAKYMKELLRINISTQSAAYREIRYNSTALIDQMKAGNTVNIDGYEMCWAMYEQAIRINLLDGPLKFDGQAIVVEINRQPSKKELRLKSLAGMYRKGNLFEAVEEPFWKEIRQYYFRANNLYQVTLDRMKQHER
jgi:exosortase A-associated hydrolase 2